MYISNFIKFIELLKTNSDLDNVVDDLYNYVFNNKKLSDLTNITLNNTKENQVHNSNKRKGLY